MQELDITLMIDADGNWIICKADDDHLAIWEEAIGTDVVSAMTNYAIKLKVPAAKPVPVAGTLPDAGDKPLTLAIS